MSTTGQEYGVNGSSYARDADLLQNVVMVGQAGGIVQMGVLARVVTHLLGGYFSPL